MHMIYAFFLLIHRLQAPNLSESRSCSSFHNKNLVKHGVQIQPGILAYNTNINTLSIREPCRNLFHLKPLQLSNVIITLHFKQMPALNFTVFCILIGGITFSSFYLLGQLINFLLPQIFCLQQYFCMIRQFRWQMCLLHFSVETAVTKCLVDL